MFFFNLKFVLGPRVIANQPTVHRGGASKGIVMTVAVGVSDR